MQSTARRFSKCTVPVDYILSPIRLSGITRKFQKMFHNSTDLRFRYIGDRFLIVYLYTIVDTQQMDLEIIAPLRDYEDQGINRILSTGSITYMRKWTNLCKKLTRGFVIIFMKGAEKPILVPVPKWEKRTAQEPDSEKQIRGPREGFIEDLESNIALLRKRMSSPTLVFEEMEIGSVTETRVLISYIAGLCDPEILAEVRRRLSLINIQSVIDSGYIEEFVVDHPRSIFPQVEQTERPDKMLGQLLEGRVAIMVNGSPMVIIVPTIFTQFVQATEDHYENYMYTSFLRLLRMIALPISMFLPGLYVAITTIHQEMIPTELALKIAGAREGVPFPAIVEALIMEVAFELLREAGVRLPAQVGQALSIVGALIIGQAAVDAGIVSPIMVIVVALSGISSFVIPAYRLSIGLRLLRFVFLISASLLGLVGMVLAVLFLLVHLSSMQSFGVPYFEPMGPLKWRQFRDWLYRQSWKQKSKQPYNIAINKMENKASSETPPISQRGNYRR